MTAPALLPPDPSVPGRYWLKTDHSPEPEVWTWDPQEKYWKQGGRWLSVRAMQLHHATLASRHPIPGPAALEAVWEALAALTREQKWCEALPETDLFNQGRALGFEAAAAMLRAALETKETT